MAKSEAKIRFTAETSEFNKAIQKSNSEMSELRAELKLNETQMKASGKTVEQLEKKHEILEKQLKASQDKTAALSQKVEKAAEVFGENSTEASKLRVQLLNAKTAEEKLRQSVAECEAEIREQENAARQAEAAAEQLDNEANDLSGSLKKAGNSARDASDGFTVLNGAMADLAADGIEKVASGLGEISTNAITAANDIDKATNTFIARTGESADSAERYEGIMLSIYNGNYGESIEDVADAMATVKTSLGDISDEQLQSVTTQALILRDTFGMDVNESILAVKSLMDQFGISAEEAYSLIAQGAQSGLNQNGDLLDVVNEYAVQFKQAGYSADDMFNMLANGVASGTWSVDKLGDAVKEFNIRMSDGSAKEAVEALGFSWEEVSAAWSAGGESAQEVFNMLFSELDGLENTTEGYSIGVGLLGTMYEDLGQNAVLALSNTNGEISATKDALGEINAVKYNDLGSALQGIGRNLQTSLAEPIKTEVMPAVNEFIEDVDWTAVGQTIGTAFGAIVEAAIAVGTAIKDATKWMMEHKGVVIAVASVIGILATAITAYNAVQAVKAAMEAANVTTVWALVGAHLAQAAAAIAAVAPYVLIVAAIAAVIAIIVVLIKNWDKVVEACKKAWAAVKATLAQWGAWINANVVQPVKNFFSNLWTSIRTAASNAWSAIKNTWSAVKGWFNSTIIQPVGNFFSNLWSKVTSAASNAWSNLKSTVSNTFEAVKNTVRNAINKIKGFFNFDWSLPHIKLPHFSISGSFSLKPPSVPKLSVDWYKEGGILTQATIFGMNGNRLLGGGEAGPEAVLPIDKLEGYISGAIEKTMNVASLESLASAIEDLASRPIQLSVNGRRFMEATASDGDSVNGLRSSFKGRGLAIE